MRLWIELLKNAFYTEESQHKELETLPNIDINIKQGNSLISRYALDLDLKEVFKKKKYNIDKYKKAVSDYRQTRNKDTKNKLFEYLKDIKEQFKTSVFSKEIAKISRLRGKIQLLENPIDLFGSKKIDKALIKKEKAKLKKLETIRDETLGNKIYQNAFEWRFEFPEVLDNDGNYIGFDCVIGNPPYVFGGNEGINNNEKGYYKKFYETGKGKINLFNLFIELSSNILNNRSQFSFIIPNTFLRVTSYHLSRVFFVKNFMINTIGDFGDTVFDDAITTAIVLLATKDKVNDNYDISIKKTDKTSYLNIKNVIDNEYVFAINTDVKKLHLVSKIKTQSVKLGSLCKEMIFGVVISGNRDEVVSNIQHEGWKPFLEGREIGAYYIKPIHTYLDYNKEKLHRSRTKEIFESKEKILIQRITGGSMPLKASFDDKQYYNKESINNIILSDDSKEQGFNKCTFLSSNSVG